MGWGTGNLGGGSGGLNFKIVSYATKSELLADTPKENTIGVITSIPIKGYHFGTEEPSPAAAGMVWITTGTSSAVEFNSLKKNAIQVYPLSAKQQDGSAWVDVTALSYQGGEWVEWFDGTVYDNGKFAPGFSYVTKAGNTESWVDASTDAYLAATGRFGFIYLTPKIDMTPYTTLTMKVKNGSRVGVSSDGTESGLIAQKSAGATKETEYTVDITDVNEEAYITFTRYASSGTATFYLYYAKLS